MTASASFDGFPPQAIQFLADLRENNNKPWFEANKKTFQREVQAPALALVAALGERLAAAFPRITYDTRANGAGTLMRIYRDTRFSADKTPYKTSIAMMFTASAGGRMEQPGFGLQLTPESLDLMAGVFQFSKPALARYREVVSGERAAATLEQAVGTVLARDGYALGGETYKRVPQGFDAGYRYARWLKFSGLHVFSPAMPAEAATRPDVVDTVMAHLAHMAPVQQWLDARVYDGLEADGEQG
jgi:uncharacterized protein (TIGR02453 family)